MPGTGIKVGEDWMDFPADGQITFELNSSAFEDDIIPGNFSFPVDFPATPNNDKIYKHARLIDSYSKVRSVNGQFYCLGNFFDKCKAVRLESSKSVYRSSVILNGISIDIKGKSIKDIDFSIYNKSFSQIPELIDWLIECNNLSNGEQPVVWPIIENSTALSGVDNGSWIGHYLGKNINKWYDENTLLPYSGAVNDNNFPRIYISPMIRVISILERIFSLAGYKLNGSFILDPEQRDLCMYSNKLMLADYKAIVHASATNLTVTIFSYYFTPVVSIGPDAMDQDYENRLDVWHDAAVLSYPDDLPKIKVNSTDDVHIMVRMKATTPSGTQSAGLGVIITNPSTGAVIDVLSTSTLVTEDLNEFTFYTLVTASEWATYGVPTEALVFPQVGVLGEIFIEKISIQVFQNAIVDDVIEDFKLNDFLPDIQIEDFLRSIKTAFNLNFNFDFKTQTISLDYSKLILEQPCESIDNRINDNIPTTTIDRTGYEFNWDFSDDTDLLLQENFKAIDPPKFIGRFPFYVPDPIEGKFLIIDNTNQILRGERNEIGDLVWTHYTDAFYSTKIGDGSKKITPVKMAPLMMRTAFNSNPALVPAISCQMNYARYNQIVDEYSYIRIAFYRGLQERQSSSNRVPVASTMRLPNSADPTDPFGKYRLIWDKELADSNYSLFWKKWISFIRNADKIRDRIQVDLPFIQRIFQTQKKFLNTILVASKLTFTVSGSQIKEAEIEMYRNNYQFDPEDGQ